MNTKILALCVLTSTFLCAENTRGFAPYDKERGFGFDAHFEGNMAFNREKKNGRAFGIPVKVGDPDFFSFALNGYYKWESGIFTKFGVNVYAMPIFKTVLFPLPLPNLQIGKYYDDIGALRVGLFNGMPGIGGDYWLLNGKLKLLTTGEIFGAKPKHGDIILGARWLNRLFVTDKIYFTGGIQHFGGSSFGFLGLGIAF